MRERERERASETLRFSERVPMETLSQPISWKKEQEEWPSVRHLLTYLLTHIIWQLSESLIIYLRPHAAVTTTEQINKSILSVSNPFSFHSLPNSFCWFSWPSRECAWNCAKSNQVAGKSSFPNQNLPGPYQREGGEEGLETIQTRSRSG